MRKSMETVKAEISAEMMRLLKNERKEISEEIQKVKEDNEREIREVQRNYVQKFIDVHTKIEKSAEHTEEKINDLSTKVDNKISDLSLTVDKKLEGLRTDLKESARDTNKKIDDTNIWIRAFLVILLTAVTGSTIFLYVSSEMKSKIIKQSIDQQQQQQTTSATIPTPTIEPFIIIK